MTKGVADSYQTARSTSFRSARSSIGSTPASCRSARRSVCDIHVSGGEFNVAANLADCFGLRTGIATAMVDYPIGDLVAERVRAMGVKPFYKRFEHDGVRGPNMATVYSDRGHGVRGARRLLQPRQRSRARCSSPATSTGTAIFAGGVRWFHSGGIFAALSETTSELIIEGMQAAKAHGAVVSFDLNYREKLWSVSGGAERALVSAQPDRRARRRARRQRGRPAEGPGHPGPGGRGEVQARSERFFGMIDRVVEKYPEDQGRRDDAARSPLDESSHAGAPWPGSTAERTSRRRASSTCSTASAAATASPPDSSTAC